MRQQLLWFLIGANVWTLVVTAGDPDCYESVGVDVKFDGNCRNTKSYLLIVGSEELEIHFNGNNNPSDHRAIDLNIGGCTLRVSYQDGEVNGAFTYKAHLITQATATSNQIKFANSEAPTKNCSVTFQPTKDKKYKVNVAVDQAQDKFSIVFMKASFDPSVTSGYPLWLWIVCSVLGAGAVMGVIVTVIICYKKNKKQKAPLAESKLPNVAVDPASKKHGHRSRHKKARSYRNKPIGHKKSIHHKKAHSAHERRVVAKNDEPKNDDPKNGEKADKQGKFGRQFVDEMSVMKLITAPPQKGHEKPQAAEKPETVDEITSEEIQTMKKRAEVFKKNFNYECGLQLTPKQISRFHHRPKNAAEVSAEPENEWTRYNKMAKENDVQKSTIAHVFEITDGKKVFKHASVDDQPMESAAKASSECGVEMPVDPLDDSKFARLRKFISYQPWIVRMILWFIEDPLDVGQELDEAKGEIKLVIDHLPPGKSRDFFAAKLKAVKFVGSIVDDVLACQGGTKKFHYPWGFRDGRELALLSRKAILSGLYLDPADCHEIEALKAQLAEMEEELRVMKDDKKRQKFASQVERMKFLVYHCTEAEKLEATREVAFAAGKSKQRSTNAVDDDEKFGV